MDAKNKTETRFTEKQLKEIYSFLEQYVPEDKLRAKQDLFSIITYDRTLMKQRLTKAWYKFMEEIDYYGLINWR